MAKKSKKELETAEDVATNLSAEQTDKKTKKVKKVKTREQKLKKKRLNIIISTVVFAVIFLFFMVCGITTKVGSDGLLEAVSRVNAVKYSTDETDRIYPEIDEATGKAKIDENGCYNFIDTNNILEKRNFKVLQLTDIHIGAGAFSIRTDKWTIETVEDIVRKAEPDLVVVTGDIAYPVFFQSATLNNRKEAKIFATLMEKLGVYWTFAFGNHDTELYSSYTREDIGAYYHDTPEFKHCLFNNKKPLVDGKEIFGTGNFAINVRKADRTLVHSIFMVDSNSYREDDPLGAKWHYDAIHDDQIAWYENMCDTLGLTGSESAKSTMYFHIPIKEFKTVFDLYNQQVNPNKDISNFKPSQTNPAIGKEFIVSGVTGVDQITNFKLCNGVVGEWGKGALGTDVQTNIYNSLVKKGTTGLFCGHDHMNNSSYWIKKGNNPDDKIGLKLTYGMSVDYLAYPGIYKKTAQRGGRIIEINEVGKLVENKTADYEGQNIDDNQAFGFITYRVPYWKDKNNNTTASPLPQGM